MSEKLYNELAKYYDLFNFNDYKKQADFIIEIINKYLKANQDIKILDLSCGTGGHINLLKSNYNIEGLDINQGMLAVAQEKNPDINFKVGDLNNLELPADSYNLIYCFSSSIQYVLNPQDLLKVFQVIHRSLKDKGIFIFDLAYCKEKWQEGYVGVRTVVQDNLQLAEIFKSRSVDNVSYYNPIYLINENNDCKFYIDDHKIFLYSINQIKSDLKKTGFSEILVKHNYSNNDFNIKNNGVPVFVNVK